MKTTVTALIALFSVFSIPASALAQQLSVGARGGYSRTTLAYDGAEQIETNWNPNFHIGAASRLELHRSFALQLEVWYVEKSTGVRWPADGEEGDVELSYLEIPFLVQVRMPLGPDSKVTPQLFVGPSVAFELDCGVAVFADGELVTAGCDAPFVQFERKTIALNLVFGAGIDIQAGPGAILLDAMYDLGLTNLNDDPAAPDDSVKNKAWLLSIGYLIPVVRW